VDPAYEHGLLVDTGSIALASTVVVRGELGYTGVGAGRLALEDLDGTGSRALLIGGAPFGEEIVMWWNFVARSHDEVVAMREEWNARTARFGEVDGYVGSPSWLPAPELPHVVLRPRGNAPNVVSA
jgi:redox-sensitive bicupin YhaK (pirin superfamily)